MRVALLNCVDDAAGDEGGLAIGVVVGVVFALSIGFILDVGGELVMVGEATGVVLSLAGDIVVVGEEFAFTLLLSEVSNGRAPIVMVPLVDCVPLDGNGDVINPELEDITRVRGDVDGEVVVKLLLRVLGGTFVALFLGDDVCRSDDIGRFVVELDTSNSETVGSSTSEADVTSLERGEV